MDEIHTMVSKKQPYVRFGLIALFTQMKNNPPKNNERNQKRLLYLEEIEYRMEVAARWLLLLRLLQSAQRGANTEQSLNHTLNIHYTRIIESEAYSTSSKQ
jgi:hypothetical protein